METFEYRYYIRFENFLFDGMLERWSNEVSPENELTKLVMEGELELLDEYANQLDEAAKYNIGMEAVVLRRQEFYENMVNADDIVEWCKKHVKL